METKILTNLQKDVLAVLFGAGLRRQGYYLTGGTALAEFYLQHRYSDDLDLFTRGERDPRSDFEQVRSVLAEMGLTVDVRQASMQHLTATLELSSKGELLRLDLARDVAARMAPPLQKIGIVVDSFEDIAVNKVCTILSRTEPKDACDLYFILKESRFGLEYLLERAKEKEIQFETDQGKLLFAANLLDLSKLDLPLRIIKPVAAKDMRTYLIAQSEELFRRMRPRGLC